jgi:hypothetical protein
MDSQLSQKRSFAGSIGGRKTGPSKRRDPMFLAICRNRDKWKKLEDWREFQLSDIPFFHAVFVYEIHKETYIITAWNTKPELGTKPFRGNGYGIADALKKGFVKLTIQKVSNETEN